MTCFGWSSAAAATICTWCFRVWCWCSCICSTWVLISSRPWITRRWGLVELAADHSNLLSMCTAVSAKIWPQNKSQLVQRLERNKTLVISDTCPAGHFACKKTFVFRQSHLIELYKFVVEIVQKPQAELERIVLVLAGKLLVQETAQVLEFEWVLLLVFVRPERN